MNLILLQRGEVDERGRACVLDHRAEHIREVLRANPGDEIRVGLVDGPLGEAMLLTVDAITVEMECTFEPKPPPRPLVDLLLALPRPKVMKRLWAQLAALGVGRILLTNAARVERNYFDTHVIDPAFFTPLLLEGLQQARDTWLPVVSIHKRFKPLVEDELDALCPPPMRLVADPRSRNGVDAAIRRIARDWPRGPSVRIGPPETPLYEPTDRRLLLAVGPEGGWVPFELDLLRAHGFRAIGLGERALRSDTACVALLALVHDALARGADAAPGPGIE